MNEDELKAEAFDDKHIKAAMEALLFAKGAPVDIDELAAAVGVKRDRAMKCITELSDEYMSDNRGIHIVKIEDAFELATKKEFYDVLAQYVSRDNKYVFSEAMLETLSIVAYKQPVTRTQVEEVRGVNCSTSISRLVEYGLIFETGRLDAPGRPFLYATTDEFLRRFDLGSLDDLPDVSEDLLGQMKLELETEEEPDNTDEDISDKSGDKSAEDIEDEPVIGSENTETDNTTDNDDPERSED